MLNLTTWLVWFVNRFLPHHVNQCHIKQTVNIENFTIISLLLSLSNLTFLYFHEHIFDRCFHVDYESERHLLPKSRGKNADNFIYVIT